MTHYRTITLSPGRIMAGVFSLLLVFILAFAAGATAAKYLVADICRDFGGFSIGEEHFICGIEPPHPGAITHE